MKDNSTVRVGVLYSLSGTMALGEKPMSAATQMAVDEINASGGILGRQVQAVVRDGASTPSVFAGQAVELLEQECVSTIFGCWISSSRKAVKPIVEQHNALLWYPVQYEGLEQSDNIIYTGSCLNQQVQPAIVWAFSRGMRRCFLVGSDYVFPRTVNRLIRALVVKAGGSVLGECYVPLGSDDFEVTVESVLACHPDIVFNTINGDGNIAFFRELHNSLSDHRDCPVMSFSLSENELRQVAKEAAGHYACCSYFQSVQTPENAHFVREFRGRFGTEVMVSDPVATAYTQVYLWKKAVEKASSFEMPEIARHIAGCSVEGLSGTVEIQSNHHVKKPALIGLAVPSGQFEVIWSSDGPIEPKPWLGIEDIDLPSKELVLEALSQYSEVIHQSVELQDRVRSGATALERSQVLLGTIIDSTADLVFAVDAENFNMLSFNRSLREYYRRLKRRIEIGMSPEELLPGEHAKIWRAYFKRALKEGQFTAEYTSYDGERILQSHFNVLKHGDEVFGISVFARDVTRQKKAEVKLRESERKARAIFDFCFGIVGLLTRTGTLIEVNRAALDFAGVRLADVLGKPFWETPWWSHSPKVQEELRASVQKASAGFFVRFETTNRASDGTLHTIDFSLRPVKDEKGEVVWLIPEGRDITDRKKAEERLRKSEQQLKAQLENSPDFIFVLDREYRFVSVNRSLSSDISPEEMIGLDAISRLPAVERNRLKAAFAKCFASGEIQMLEHALHDDRWFSIRIVPIKQNGDVEAIMVISTEITKERLLREQLAQAQKIEAVGQLASGVAHDFNNLLTVIFASTEVLIRGLADTALKSSVEMIRESANQAAGVTKSLLTFSRRLPSEKKRIDLCQTVDESTRLLNRMLPATIELVTDINYEVPNWINADPVQIQQIVMNLALNARDAMPEGGTLRVSVAPVPACTIAELNGKVSPEKSFAQLVVSDTGIGIPEELRARLFEPFFTTKPRGQGTGLGLSIIHSIVEEHDGVIGVESEPGQGTRFAVLLPCTLSDEAVTRDDVDERVLQGNGELVLLADDNASILRHMTACLEKSGYRVLQVHNGEEMANCWREKRGQIKMIVSDVDMPKQSGSKQLEEIRKSGDQTPAILITGSSGFTEETKLDINTRVLQKPFMMDELTRQIGDILKSGGVGNAS